MGRGAELSFRLLVHGLALVLAAGGGLVGASLFFSDLGPDETLVERLVAGAVVHVVPAVFVGALVPRRWWLCLLGAWGAVLVGALSAWTRSWELAGLGLLAAPTVVVAGGLIGSALARRAMCGTGRAADDDA